jgi:hypothetical protein
MEALSPLLYRREFVDSPMWRRHGATIKSILRGMLQANPRKRLDCVEALKLYDPITLGLRYTGLLGSPPARSSATLLKFYVYHLSSTRNFTSLFAILSLCCFLTLRGTHR